MRNKTEAMAFEYLTDKKLKHKKVRKLIDNNLQMAEFLEPNYLNTKLADAQFLFQLKKKWFNN